MENADLNPKACCHDNDYLYALREYSDMTADRLIYSNPMKLLIMIIFLSYCGIYATAANFGGSTAWVCSVSRAISGFPTAAM